MTIDRSNYEEVISALADYLDSVGCEINIIVQKKRRHYQRDIEYVEKTYGATNVKERREAIGKSQRQLAKELGISQMIVERMEDPELRHKEESMVRFAKYFGVSIEDLLISDENGEKSV